MDQMNTERWLEALRKGTIILSDSTPSVTKPLTMKQVQINAVLNALAYTRGNMRRASELLDIQELTVRRYLKLIGVHTGDPKTNKRWRREGED